MKALDTPALLSLLEGEPSIRSAIRRWRGEEIATTEANLLELAVIAASGPARGRSHRLGELGRLRQRLTVLPLDARSAEEGRRHLERGSVAASPTVIAMLSALEAAGCEELITDEPARIPGKWRFRVTKIAKGKQQKS